MTEAELRELVKAIVTEVVKEASPPEPACGALLPKPLKLAPGGTVELQFP